MHSLAPEITSPVNFSVWHVEQLSNALQHVISMNHSVFDDQPSWTSPLPQECMGAWVHGCMVTGLQDYRSAGVQECRITGVHGHRITGVQESRSPGVQESMVTESQECRSAGPGSPIDVVGADLSAKRSGLLTTDARSIIAPQHRVNNPFLDLWHEATIQLARWPGFCSCRSENRQGPLSPWISKGCVRCP